MVAIINGTNSEYITTILQKIPLKLRKKVVEITLDMAGSMNLIAKKNFSNAVLVTDRFHGEKLALVAAQELRVKHRWEALDKENEAIEKPANKRKHIIQSFLKMETPSDNY